MNRYLTLMRHALIMMVASMPIILLAGHSSLEFPNEETLACNDYVNVSVNSSCELDLSPEDLLVGQVDPSTYRLDVFSSPGVIIDQGDMTRYVGRELTYHVVDVASGVTCGGIILVEAKEFPAIDCSTCTDPDVVDPECIFNCAQLPLFITINPETRLRGYDARLLDQIIPSDIEGFLNDNVTNNCGQPATARYIDGSTAFDCEGGATLTRRWIVEVATSNGGTVQQECIKYYKFLPLTIVDDTGAPIIVEGDGTPIEDMILMPPKNVLLPVCNSGYTPADVAAFYDDPETIDRDSNDDGVDPDEGDIDCVIENNEGIWRAYPHYYLHGIRPSGLHAQPLDSDNSICTINADYSDVIIDACGADCAGNVKISRTWTMLDWCKGETFVYRQIIEAADSEAPTMTITDVNASVSPHGCFADVVIPAPTKLFDACDPNPTYTVRIPASAYQVEGNATDGYTILGLRTGTYDLHYISEDCCGNQNDVAVTLEVSDRTAPVPVVIRNIVIDLSSSGQVAEPDRGLGKVFATDVDNGSFDSCTGVDVYVRRPFSCQASDTIWSESVEFCCNDIASGTPAIIDVEFRAVDYHGNENFSWTTITVEDKGSRLICPLDMALSCDDDIWSYDLTGTPIALTSCANIPLAIDTLDTNDRTEPRDKRAGEGSVPGYIGVAVPAYDPQCGFGAIRRQWRSGGSTICEQWFVLEPNGNPFDPSTIEFPDDINVSCEAFVSEMPTFLAPSCNLVAVSLDSDTLRFEGDACIKILNSWSVIDWCIYNPADTDLNDVVEPSDNGVVEGRYDHLQVIKVEDSTRPTIEVENDLVFSVNTDCEGKGITLSATGIDGGDCPNPQLGWEVRVDLNSDWNFEYEYNTNAPAIVNGEPNLFAIPRTDNGAPLFITLPDGITASKNRHRIEWIVKDGCRNETLFTSFFTIEDTTPPTPYCLNVGTTVMENGEVELWAADFNVASFDQCTDEENIFFTFTDVPPPPRCDLEYDGNRDREWYDGSFWYFDATEGLVDVNAECPLDGHGAYSDGGYNSTTGEFEDYGSDIHIWRPSARTSGRVFTTDDVSADNIIQIPVYAWDECGNNDFCLVLLRIIDNNGGATGMVAGVVMTEEGQAVEDVTTELVSDIPGYPKQKLTDRSGTYAFDNNLLAQDYALTATREDDYLNGVSTVDLIMIQRHILGQQPLDSPYKMIAADVNSDNRINGIDLVELRKLILGIYTELPQNDSWKIIDSRSTMDLSQPWDYSQTIQIADMTENMVDQDFVGVKIGDVDNSAIVNSLGNDEGNASKIILTMDDVALLADEEVDINFELNKPLSGYQLELDLTDMELIAVEGNGISDANIYVNNGRLAISVDDVDVTAPVSFTLRVISSVPGNANDRIAISNRRIEAEGYSEDGLEAKNLIFESERNAFLVSQNEPNPFSTVSNINYELPHAGNVRFTLATVDGRVLKNVTYPGQKGRNVIKVDGINLEGGVLYYMMEFEGETITRKMIIIE